MIATQITENETVTQSGGGRNLDFYRPVPPNGKRCEFTGMGHAWFYTRIIGDPVVRKRVRLVHMKKPDQARAKWLYNVNDLLAYLDDLALEQALATEIH